MNKTFKANHFSPFSLLHQQPRRRPTIAAIIESLRRIRTLPLLLNDKLTDEVHRLREQLHQQTAADEDLQSRRQSQLDSKDEELRSKNVEIQMLQQRISEMERQACEMQVKDAEIQRLKLLLDQRNVNGFS